MKRNAIKNLSEKVKTLFLGANENGNIPLREYVMTQAESDPSFFRWLFDQDFDKDFDSSLTPSQEEEYKEFLDTL